MLKASNQNDPLLKEFVMTYFNTFIHIFTIIESDHAQKREKKNIAWACDNG